MVHKPNTRLIVTTLLACLLLLAQHGAAVHALSHLYTDAAAQQPQQYPPAPDLDLHSCDKCTGYAGLSAALHTDPLLFNGHAANLVQISPAQFVVAFHFFRPYYSRGPPQLVEK